MSLLLSYPSPPPLQARVFNRPPEDVRKVVIATNIAGGWLEGRGDPSSPFVRSCLKCDPDLGDVMYFLCAETSITIDDVVWVIDSGRVKENRYSSETHMQVRS